MKNVRPLPAREPPRAGESLAGLVRRTAEAMGYEGVRPIRALLSEAGEVPVHFDHLGPGPVMNRLACLLRWPAVELVGLTMHRFADLLTLMPFGAAAPGECDSKTILKYFVSAVSPVCSECLQGDPVPYDRLVWSLRAVPVCLRHDCALVMHCEACRRPIRPGRDNTMLCACKRALTENQALRLSTKAVAVARNLAAWFCGDAVPLPHVRASAAIWWLQRMAVAVSKTPEWIKRVAGQLDLDPHVAADLLPWLAAADIFNGWPQRLEEFLEEFQQVTKHHTCATGLSRRFGLLLRHAAYLEQLEYPTIADVLRQYLLRTYNGGHVTSKVCLFRQAEQQSLLKGRSWITQTEAADLLHIRHGAVAELVQRGVLVGKIHPAGKKGRSVGLVARESAQEFRGDLCGALGVEQVAERLGVGRSRIFELIRAGLLPRSVRTVKGWRVPQRSVRDLLDLYRRLPPLCKKSSGWLTFRQATRQFGPAGLTFVRLLELVRDGRVDARRDPAQQTFQGLLISCNGVRTVVPIARTLMNQYRGYSLHRLAKILFTGRPTKERVLKKWIRAGLLKAKRKGRRTFVSAAEVDRFRATYCLSAEACRLLGVSRATVARWEAEGRLVPAYGKRVTPAAGFSLYRRDDIERLAAGRMSGKAA